MISYAYNREDVLLNRLFKDQGTGFYVDVGAGKPVRGSVTKHFYDRGWRGVNVEPTRSLFGLLQAARPEDVNLNLALSFQPGSMEFYEFEERHWALSTLDKQHAERHSETGRRYQAHQIRVKTLAEICEEYVTGEIDFMSIDVEGHELGVVQGGDWRRWRPRCVVVEATQPNTQIPSHSDWEPLLLEAGYLFAYFDGLNRFYLRSEDAGLMECFQTPVNVFDDFETFESRWLLDAARNELAALSAEHKVRMLFTTGEEGSSKVWCEPLGSEHLLAQGEVFTVQISGQGSGEVEITHHRGGVAVRAWSGGQLRVVNPKGAER